jgi:hypothetical protein
MAASTNTATADNGKRRWRCCYIPLPSCICCLPIFGILVPLLLALYQTLSWVVEHYSPPARARGSSALVHHLEAGSPEGLLGF